MPYTYKSSRSSSITHKYSRNRTGSPRRNGAKRNAGQYIDPSRFIKAATFTQAEAYQAQHTYADFPFVEPIASNLLAKGYVTPTPIQDQTIPTAILGQDIIGIASTGTGKTAAFALPILNRLLTEKASAALIVAPTRELAQQIEDECRALAKGSGLMGALLIGGTGMGGQLKDLKLKPRIVIGTPGRILDHLERGTLKLQHFNMVVLDEVDRMLDMGFVNDVTAIINRVNEKRQSFFFSATIDQKVRTLIESFTNDPFTVSLKASSASENVHQDIVRYSGTHEKMDKLHDILLSKEVEKVIVFDETQRSVERLSNELISRGFAADAIHGGKSQGQRQRALNRFKKSEIRILVATDVAARGIDVSDITHVVNYSVPKMYDDYIHRIGRAGRAGAIGYALTFVAH